MLMIMAIFNAVDGVVSNFVWQAWFFTFAAVILLVYENGYEMTGGDGDDL